MAKITETYAQLKLRLAAEGRLAAFRWTMSETMAMNPNADAKGIRVSVRRRFGKNTRPRFVHESPKSLPPGVTIIDSDVPRKKKSQKTRRDRLTKYAIARMDLIKKLGRNEEPTIADIEATGMDTEGLKTLCRETYFTKEQAARVMELAASISPPAPDATDAEQFVEHADARRLDVPAMDVPLAPEERPPDDSHLNMPTLEDDLATPEQILDDIRWVYSNMGKPPKTAPVGGRLGMWQWAQKSLNEFYKTMVPRILPKDDERDQILKQQDDGRAVFALLDRVRAARQPKQEPDETDVA